MIHENFGLKARKAFWNVWFESPLLDENDVLIQRQTPGIEIDWGEVEAAKFLFRRYVIDQKEDIKDTADAGDWKLVFTTPDTCPDFFCPHKGTKFCDKGAS